jgi:hypothetical protein
MKMVPIAIVLVTLPEPSATSHFVLLYGTSVHNFESYGRSRTESICRERVNFALCPTAFEGSKRPGARGRMGSGRRAVSPAAAGGQERKSDART